MLAYLVMMAPRLVELRRTMKPTASIYLHCDPTAQSLPEDAYGRHLRPENFGNEIIWQRTNAKGLAFLALLEITMSSYDSRKAQKHHGTHPIRSMILNI